MLIIVILIIFTIAVLMGVHTFTVAHTLPSDTESLEYSKRIKYKNRIEGATYLIVTIGLVVWGISFFSGSLNGSAKYFQAPHELTSEDREVQRYSGYKYGNVNFPKLVYSKHVLPEQVTVKLLEYKQDQIASYVGLKFKVIANTYDTDDYSSPAIIAEVVINNDVGGVYESSDQVARFLQITFGSYVAHTNVMEEHHTTSKEGILGDSSTTYKIGAYAPSGFDPTEDQVNVINLNPNPSANVIGAIVNLNNN